jgi:hypothetical protein
MYINGSRRNLWDLAVSCVQSQLRSPQSVEPLHTTFLVLTLVACRIRRASKNLTDIRFHRKDTSQFYSHLVSSLCAPTCVCRTPLQTTSTGAGRTRRCLYEQGEEARAPYSHEPRDVPRCGALSLLQKPLLYRGIQHSSCPALV